MYGSKILPFTSSILKASMASNSNHDNESQMRKYFFNNILLFVLNPIVYLFKLLKFLILNDSCY